MLRAPHKPAQHVNDQGHNRPRKWGVLRRPARSGLAGLGWRRISQRAGWMRAPAPPEEPGRKGARAERQRVPMELGRRANLLARIMERSLHPLRGARDGSANLVIQGVELASKRGAGCLYLVPERLRRSYIEA